MKTLLGAWLDRSVGVRKWGEFAAWHMPMEFEGALKEHMAVRKGVGLFDVSHMGELRIRGKGALIFLNALLANDPRRLAKNKSQYTLVLNSQGGVVDDCILYCLEPTQDYLLCVNAANTHNVLEHFRQHLGPGVSLEDESDAWGLLALQGPKSVEVARDFLADDWTQLQEVLRFGVWRAPGGVIWARTGYTGELGYEIFVPAGQLCEFAERLWQVGRARGMLWVGLAARDSLRLEMGYPLHGAELREDMSPLAAGLGWAIKSHGRSFVGCEAAKGHAQAGAELHARLIGVELSEARPLRRGASIAKSSSGESECGQISSGGYSPVLSRGVGLGYVVGEVGESCYIGMRGGKWVRARVVVPPFVRGGL